MECGSGKGPEGEEVGTRRRLNELVTVDGSGQCMLRGVRSGQGTTHTYPDGGGRAERISGEPRRSKTDEGELDMWVGCEKGVKR